MGASFQQRARDDEGHEVFCIYVLAILVMPILFLPLYMVVTETPPPRYSIAIGTVSGLDPDTDLQERQLQVGEHVRAGVIPPRAARRRAGAGAGQCTIGRRIDLAVVARGRGVAVPGFLLDNLVEDMQREEAVFEVTLMSPDGGGWNVMTCWGKAGDDAILEAPCVRSWVQAGLPVPSRSGGGYVPLPSKVVHAVAEEQHGSPAFAGTYATI